LPITVQDAGRRGARKRWAATVPVRPYIGDLPEHQRRLVMAAIQAEREKLHARLLDCDVVAREDVAGPVTSNQDAA
jgi:hypothetical protein